jgi:pimeloyl-ACP methyl ester carboxylesterase
MAPEVSSDLFWADGTWNSGGKDDSAYAYSGFAAMDDLVASLNATQVTIVGHSGGGQFAHRYALSTLTSRAMRFVVANPSSYTYLDPLRPDLTAPGYLIPSVSSYDAYRYGLASNLNTYLKQQSVDEMKARYLGRKVTYLLGDADCDPNSSSLDITAQAQTQGAHRFERGTRYFQYLNDRFSGHAHARVVVPGVGHSGKSMIQSTEGKAVIFG